MAYGSAGSMAADKEEVVDFLEESLLGVNAGTLLSPASLLLSRRRFKRVIFESEIIIVEIVILNTDVDFLMGSY